MMLWMPESPHWLVTNNKTKDLKKTMQRLIDINRSKLDLKVRKQLYLLMTSDRLFTCGSETAGTRSIHSCL